MPGTSPGMTTFDMMPHSIGRILSQTLRTSGHPPCRLLDSPDTHERGMPPPKRVVEIVRRIGTADLKSCNATRRQTTFE
jgi:hypothetical protein